MEDAQRIIKESARFGWPGRMSDMLKKGSKKTTEQFLQDNVTLDKLAEFRTQGDYDLWHRKVTCALAKHLGRKLVRKFSPKSTHQTKPYLAEAVSAKLIDLFMYALVKHSPFRPLYAFLHLPLDEVARASLRRLQREKTFNREVDLSENVYTLTYDEHMRIQALLWPLVNCTFSKMKASLGRSRAWLNIVLWVQ